MAIPTKFTAESLVDAINTFTFTLQRKVEGRPVCGSNIYSCLLMAAYGYRGQSRQQLAEVLGIAHADFETVCAQFKELDSQICGDGAVNTANSVWYRKGVSVSHDFLDFIDRNFNGHTGEINIDAISDFVRGNTLGKIDFRSTVSSATALMLVACLYFKAAWSIPFDRDYTIVSRFHPFDKKPVRCNLMRSTEQYRYFEDDKLQAAILPYKTPGHYSHADWEEASLPSETPWHDSRPNWTAVFILPRDSSRKALDDILISTTASPAKWRGFITGFASAELNMYIPRFELRASSDLLPPLQDMGVISATEPSLDFWARSPPAEMWISRVSHLTYLRCDEAGTEVAAATSIVEEDGIALEPPKELIADRPFWFVLYDQTQGTVLYSGFVENVEEAGDSVFKDD